MFFNETSHLTKKRKNFYKNITIDSTVIDCDEFLKGRNCCGFKRSFLR